MNLAESNNKRKRPWLGYAAAVVFIIVDRILKQLAISSIEDATWGVYAKFRRFFVLLFPSIQAAHPPSEIFSYSLFYNRGALFSLPVPIITVTIASTLIFFALVVAEIRNIKHGNYDKAPFYFVILLGGGSNLYDRFTYKATVDYLLFFNRSAWNIADFMIIIGIIALLFSTTKSNINDKGI